MGSSLTKSTLRKSYFYKYKISLDIVLLFIEENFEAPKGKKILFSKGLKHLVLKTTHADLYKCIQSITEKFLS